MFQKTKVGMAAAMLVGGAGLLAGAVQAQTTEQRVEITGSRIKSLNGTSVSPTTSVSEEQIREAQPMAIEEIVKGLPAAIPAIGPGTNNGTGGAATIDLRGLGSNRTLVLVNGRRMVPFDLNAIVDTNSIPLALLRRVDIVTGGASAVYGADAVAGVANFVLKRDFRGVDLSTSYGVSGEGDAKRRRADITIGSALADNKGNVALSLGMTNTTPLLQGARPSGAASISSTSGNPQGSFTTVPVYLDSAQISYQLDNNGDPSPATQTFNFNPLNYYITPLKRLQGTALANYSISDKVEIYAEMMYSRSDVVSNLAPSGTFFNTFSVPIGNPFLSAATRADICTAYAIAPASCVVGNPTEFSVDIGRRFVELGPRINDFKNKTIQTVVGVRGDIMAGWNYDGYLSRGEADQLQTRVNWGSSSKVQQALRSLDGLTCVDASNGCVPLNVFGPAGSITPAMLGFINLSAILTQKVKQDVLAATVSGDLGPIRSPFAKAPISLAFGVENRKMTAGNLSDAATQINGEVLGTGAPAPDFTGTLKLNEVYGEAIIPIASGLPGVHSLNLELGYRQTEFKTTTTSRYGSWKIGGDWEPFRGLRVRAMGQRATRAPNVAELFNPLITQLDNLAVDPCEGANINVADAAIPGTLSALCVQTGVPLARVGTLPPPSAGQANILQGGNPALKPELANTLTVGFVFEPAALPGLSLSLDYYQIKITDAVSNPSIDDVMNDCYQAARNPTFAFNAACAAVGRGPGGTFNGASSPGIALPLSNLGKQTTSGVDLAVGYRFNLGALGRVDATLDLNSVDKYWFKATPNSVQRDCLGYYSIACGAASSLGGPIYKQKASQRTAWSMGDFAAGYTLRYLSKVTEEPGGTNFQPQFSTIKSYTYVDLAGSWKVTKNVEVRLAIINAFDKKPPEVGNTIGTTSANSGNTFPQSYDVVGRAFTLGGSLKF